MVGETRKQPRFQFGPPQHMESVTFGRGRGTPSKGRDSRRALPRSRYLGRRERQISVAKLEYLLVRLGQFSQDLCRVGFCPDFGEELIILAQREFFREFL